MFNFDVVSSEGEEESEDSSSSEFINVGFGYAEAEPLKALMPPIDVSEPKESAALASWQQEVQEFLEFIDVAFTLPGDDTMFNADRPAWAQFLIRCTEHLRAKFPDSPSPMRVSTTFAGANSEIGTAEALQIPCEWVSTSELLPEAVHASEVLHGPQRYSHRFSRAETQMTAASQFNLSSHLAILGPACQPWSMRRNKTGNSTRSSGATDHPWYSQTFSLLPAWLHAMDADGAIIEQVFYGFCTDVESDSNNETAALKLLKELRRKYTGVTYVKLELATWTEDFQRTRTSHTAYKSAL